MNAGHFEAGPNLGTILGGLVHDFQELFQGEIKLARIEFDQKLRKIISGAVMIVGGALVAFAGLIVLLQAVAAVLALFLPVWAALLIVGVVIVAVAALVVRAGLAMLSLKTLSPDRTWSSLRKDALMVKEHV